MGSYKSHISRTPGVQGGYPVITGTRTPVRSIIAIAGDGSNPDIKAVKHALPHLSDEQIYAALAYYREQPGLVDEDIARLRAATDVLLSRR
jgi:uncharacterized protein (DUF433 family)